MVSLFSIFFCYCHLPGPAKETLFLSLQITEIWETTISYRLSAGLSLLFHSSLITFHQIHSVWKSASHPKIESHRLFKYQRTPVKKTEPWNPDSLTNWFPSKAVTQDRRAGEREKSKYFSPSALDWVGALPFPSPHQAALHHWMAHASGFSNTISQWPCGTKDDRGFLLFQSLGYPYFQHFHHLHNNSLY